MFSRKRGLNNPEEGIKMKVGDGAVVRCLRLEDENLDALIVGNFGLTTQSTAVEVGVSEGACSFTATGTWHNFFENDTLQVSSARQFRLRPGEFRLYTSEPQPSPPMGLVPSAPTHRTTIPDVSAAEEYDFGDTGVDIAFEGTDGRHERTLDLSGLPSGTYFLRLRAGEDIRTRKLTVVQ